MLTGAQAREHYARSADVKRRAHSYVVMLQGFLSVRGDQIEFVQTAAYFQKLLRVCGDTDAALEVGRQLEVE